MGFDGTHESTTAAALEYVKHSFALVPIPRGTKGPRGTGWNLRKNCVTDEASVYANIPSDGNIGIAHVYSGTCAVDIDDLNAARAWFKEHGVDLDELLNAADAVRIMSGRPNRAKLLFKVPAGIDPASLHTKKFGNRAFELRCASSNGTTVQDVLPPSIHPDTGLPYMWAYGPAGDWREPPELPASILAIWQARIAEDTAGAVRGAKSEKKKYTGGAITAALAGAAEGTRNDVIFKYAAKLRADDVPINDAKQLVLESAAACDPPLTPAEAITCLQSAYKYKPSTPNTDYGNAQRLVARHSFNIRYCYELKKWLLWNGLRWVFDDDGGIMRHAKATVVAIHAEAATEPDDAKRTSLSKWSIASQSTNRLMSLVTLAQSEPGVPIQVAALDRNPLLLGALNGVVDLRTGTLRPAEREDYLTKHTPVPVDPEARCPRWLAFLNEIMGNGPELVAYIQRLVGYCLTGQTNEHVLVVLYGTGANGKSTFMNVLRALLGDYAVATPAETLMATKRPGGGATPDIARLRGARLVAAQESDDGHRLDEGLIKQLTGGDAIAARPLYGEFIEFAPQFKIVLATNHKPIIKGDDHAIWRRIHLVPFTVTIPEYQRDRQLGEKLIAELPGILNWAIAGCLEWQRGGLRPPEIVRAAVDSYRSDMDFISQFFADCCEIGPGQSAGATELYHAYRDWALENTGWHLTQTNFGRKLADRGFTKDRLAGVGTTVYRGVGLRPEKSLCP